MSTQRIYKVVFHNQGEIWELYARSVGPSDMFGFIQLEELLFGERSQVVVDPSEDKLKNEFKGVKRTYIPLHAVVRIDQVDRQGASRVAAAAKEGGALTPFPMPLQTGRDPSGKS